MRLRIFSEAAVFLEKAQQALELDEAQNNLMLGVALRLKAHPEWITRPPYLAFVEDEGTFLAVALMTPPRALQLVSPTRNERAMRLIAEDLKNGGWQVPGVIADQPVAEAFAQCWQSMTGCDVNINRRLETYRLDRVIFPQHVPGRLRPAQLDDLAWLTCWIQGFLQETGQGDNFEMARKMTQNHTMTGDLFVWEEDEKPLSIAARTRPLREGIAITMVYTPPEFRGRGCASACVAALCQMLLESGWKYCVLFADQASPAPNAVYRRIGFRPLERSMECLFSMPD